MKNSVLNPFIISGYIGPEFFCDRVSESEKIISSINSGRNITLISLRRMGKTGLLKHIKNKLEHKKSAYTVIYTDLLPTMTGNDMLNALSNALLKVRKEEKNFLEKMLSALASLRPRLTVDPLTGQPSIELKVESASLIQSGLDQILDLISGINRNLVLIFDEFQQISNYPEKNIEQILRTIIQAYPKVHFVFSGSSKHMLENMFMSAGRPFYQSSELMYLDRIPKDDYRPFIADNFAISEIRIDEGAIDMIFDWTRLHTWYVQYVCNKLYELNKKKIDPGIINGVFLQILNDLEPEYINYRNLIPAHQFKVLKAFAAENGVEMPTSGKFIKKYDLTSASSVNTSIKSLKEKEMIVNENGKWFVYDVFFSRWLEYHYSQV